MIVDTVKASLESSEATMHWIKKFHEEVKMGIKFIYYSYKLAKHKVTEGQKIYNVKFDYKTSNSFFKTVKIFSFLFLKIISPYLMNKLDEYIVKSQNEEESEDEELSQNSKKSKLRKILISLFKIADVILKFLESLNFIIFIATNKFPSLWQRLLNIEYKILDPSRQVNLAFNFLMKKIVWSQLSKIILFFFNFSLGRGTLKSLFSSLVSMVTEDSSADQIQDKCDICKMLFTNKTTEACGHSFCYFCISKHRLENDLCPTCLQKI